MEEALGLAGQGMIRLWEPGILEPQRCWMANAVGNGRQLVIEPWLERAFDVFWSGISRGIKEQRL